MWSPRLLSVGLALWAALGLAACGFQPLYGPTASGSRLSEAMAGIDIAPIPGRVGQKIRNELIFGTTGGGQEGAAKYKLDITIRESLVDELVRSTGEATGQVYQVEATFKLKKVGSSSPVLEGKAISRAAYDRYEQIFSNVRARYDAENRAARTIAETIRVRLAAYLQTST